MLTLMNLKQGEQARIIGYQSDVSGYRQQLLAMGLTPNTVIQVIRRAPLGDPIHIKVRDSELMLRQAEANILVLQQLERA